MGQEVRQAVAAGEAELKAGLSDLGNKAKPILLKILIVYALAVTAALVIMVLMFRGADRVNQEAVKEIKVVNERLATERAEGDRLRARGVETRYIVQTNIVGFQIAESNVAKIDAWRSNLSGSNWMDDARKYELLAH